MKYYLFIIGCQMNYSDAERLISIMNSYGLARTFSEKEADYIIVISCSVRQKAMDRIFGRLNRWRLWRQQKKVTTILTGCVLPDDKKNLFKDFDFIVDIKKIADIPHLLKLKLKKSTVRIPINADYLSFKPNYSSKFQAYVPIMTGCNNFCTFCAVPYTRGAESSRPSSEVISEISSLVKKGFKEITILGQNVNAYLDPEKIHKKNILNSRARKYWEFNKDQPIQKRTASTRAPKDFAELLKKINNIPGNFWIRFMTSNPQDVSDELLATLPQCNKVAKHFHLPIQSGDDEILRRMNRRHTRDYYIQLVEKIRKAWPGVVITTDIIVGFPGETEEQFQNTVTVMETVQYDMAYIAEYSPRPDTASERFFKDDILSGEKRRRKDDLNETLKKSALEKNKQLIGKTVRVLVDTYDKEKKQNGGKTEGFKTIHFSGENLIGKFEKVTVTDATAWGLVGKK